MSLDGKGVIGGAQNADSAVARSREAGQLEVCAPPDPGEFAHDSRELATERARYLDLYEAAPVGYVTLTPGGVITQANLAAAALLGLRPDTLVGTPLSQYMLPEDVDAHYARLLYAGGGSDVHAFQLRLLRAGVPFWVSCHVRAGVDAADPARSVVRVAFTDIDGLLRTLEIERLAAERFRTAVTNSRDIIYTFDPDGVITFVSPGGRAYFGFDPSEAIGRTFGEFVHQDDVERCQRALRVAVEGSRSDVAVECRVRHQDGNWRWVETTIAPMYDDDGAVVEYLGIARDITEHKIEAAEMQLLAMTDELTGVGNRRTFVGAIAKEFRRSQRYRYGLSLLMVDVDNLKEINDTFGHTAGDRALQLVARVCKGACREVDEACRLGGDEFAILLPHSDGLTAFGVGERVRAAVASEPVPDGFVPGFRITVSVGAGTVLPDDDDQSDVLERADEALRRAKRQGRNFTCA